MKHVITIALLIAGAYATAQDPFAQGEKILKQKTDNQLVLVRVNPKTGEQMVFKTQVKPEELSKALASDKAEEAKSQLLEKTVASIDQGKLGAEKKYSGVDKNLFTKSEDAPTQAWYYGGYGWWSPYVYIWGYTYTYTYTWYVADYWGGYSWAWYRPRPVVYY